MVSSGSLANKTKCAALLITVSVGLLSGCVSLEAIKSSDASFGVAATDRTLAQRILDRSIENTAIVNISRIDPNLSERSRITVDSFYSNVLITGEVPDEESKKQVEAVVASMPDVNRLYNRLAVANVKGPSYTVHDGYITSKLNAKILANNAIKNSQVKVITEDGVVYVMGKLTPSQREHLINIVNNTIGIKELVLLTDLIDNNGAIINEDAIIQEDNLQPPAPRYNPEQYQAVNDNGAIQNNISQQQRYVPVTKAAESPSYQAPNVETSQVVTPQGELGSTATSGSVSSNPVYTSTANGESVDSQVTPVVPDQGSDTTYASPYIEMYKNEVKGW